MGGAQVGGGGSRSEMRPEPSSTRRAKQSAHPWSLRTPSHSVQALELAEAAYCPALQIVHPVDPAAE